MCVEGGGWLRGRNVTYKCRVLYYCIINVLNTFMYIDVFSLLLLYVEANIAHLYRFTPTHMYVCVCALSYTHTPIHIHIRTFIFEQQQAHCD